MGHHRLTARSLMPAPEFLLLQCQAQEISSTSFLLAWYKSLGCCEAPAAALSSESASP